MYNTLEDLVKGEFAGCKQVTLVLNREDWYTMEDISWLIFSFLSESSPKRTQLGFFGVDENVRKNKPISGNNIENIKEIYKSIYRALTVLKRMGVKFKIEAEPADLEMLDIDVGFPDFSNDEQIEYMQKKNEQYDKIVSIDHMSMSEAIDALKDIIGEDDPGDLE